MRAIAVIVQIMKLANPAKTGFQHLHIELGCNSLHLVGVILRANLYMTVRQLQKLSSDGPRISASPAIARWKA